MSSPRDRDRLARAAALDAGIARMRELLYLGRWPTGLELTAQERRTVEWNLELAVAERANRRQRERDHARA